MKVVSLSHDAEQGMRQFVTEVVSVGRFRHRNVVPLLGYCRRRGELLLVYDYMPERRAWTSGCTARVRRCWARRSTFAPSEASPPACSASTRAGSRWSYTATSRQAT
ncbi:hypothetical protein OsJ_05391 [Oryza sativa Japonica Group]|uniref:Serine-threonine/tyrosine-protein kinase catalytic domain-containing protein n=1 Tax=Oryza sativa subsp. japonica TaxID=39947 RepID=B9F2R2_ORYSJ|nr:hypothetical protein OsJ_05391 [Oryza sativa Japonica Group]